MPLSLAEANVELTIKRITGNDKIRQHLQSIGFIEGEPIMVINTINENVIVKLRGISMALTHDMAKRIYV